MRSTARYSLRRPASAGIFLASLAAPAASQVTSRVTVSASGVQGDATSSGGDITPDGRYVAFSSSASNLVPGDLNGLQDVFVRDRTTGAIELVSVDSSGSQANDACNSARISADGRYVAFVSRADDLVGGDTNGFSDVFVRDRQNGTTEMASVDSAGIHGSSTSWFPAISADGRYVVFESYAPNLVPGDTNGGLGGLDVFVRDLALGVTERASVDSAGAEANDVSADASVSGDGRFVAFRSRASNLVAGDTNGADDVFVRDRLLGTTERVSVDSIGTQGNGHSMPSTALSADGRVVVFRSAATNLVPGDGNGAVDAFVRDRQLGTTERANVATGGGEASSGAETIAVSADGRFVGFRSFATNLVAGDTNGRADFFVRDRQAGTTERASVGPDGVQGNEETFGGFLSGDGRFASFGSRASNLVPGDTNGAIDGFVRDRLGGTSFASLCDPGIGGVIACPCANPPSGPGRGCDNSSGTGGAVLAASGGTYLSSDSLVFTTSGEKPTALSIVAQWNGTSASGVPFGMGVRCTSGTLKRLYTKTASGGSITAPSFGAGDVPVSARSAALGDPILAGQSRWYLVYYRDPIVLGGCAATSTFNATQTGRIAWAP